MFLLQHRLLSLWGEGRLSAAPGIIPILHTKALRCGRVRGLPGARGACAPNHGTQGEHRTPVLARTVSLCWPSEVAPLCPQPLGNWPSQAAGASAVLFLSSRVSPRSVPTSTGPERTRTKKNTVFSHVVDHGLSLAGIKPGSCLEEVRAGNPDGRMYYAKWKPLWGDLCASVQESCLILGFTTSRLCDLREVACPL